MAEARRKFDEDFQQGAVRLVRETGKPIAQVARGLGSTRARWATGALRTGGRAVRARSMRTSGRSWLGCRRRTPSCGWVAMS